MSRKRCPTRSETTRAKRGQDPTPTQYHDTLRGPSAECLSWGTYKLNASSRNLDAQTRPTDSARATTLLSGEAHQRHEAEGDTEAGMLSGVSRKRRMRSNPCWFTEFCKSQCLSHFAAPFIVVQAETSVAESCKEAIIGRRTQGAPRRNGNSPQEVQSLSKTTTPCEVAAFFPATKAA